MKKIISIILISTIFLCLAACGKPYTLEETTDLSVNTVENVSMVLLADTVSSTGISVCLVNDSDEIITSGNENDFYVQVQKNDGTWYSLISKRSLSNSVEAMLFDSEADYELSFDWESRYGELEPGHYRLVKNFWNDDYYNGQFAVAVEFDL